MRTLVHDNIETIEETINQCDICYLGMADTDGTPYVLPMNFGYKDGVVYLHSAPEGRHLSIIGRNPHVCLTFCSERKLVHQHPEVACSYRMRSKSVIGWGEVIFEEDLDRKVEILNIIMRQYSNKTFKYSDPAIKNVKIWKIPLENLTCREFGVSYKEK